MARTGARSNERSSGFFERPMIYFSRPFLMTGGDVILRDGRPVHFSVTLCKSKEGG